MPINVLKDLRIGNIVKIRNGEIEFRLLNAGDGEKYVFCRKVIKNKFLRIFVPWVMVRRAYRVTSGFNPFFSADDFERLLNSIKSWDDFKTWKKWQEEINLANTNGIEKSWEKFKNQ